MPGAPRSGAKAERCAFGVTIGPRSDAGAERAESETNNPAEPVGHSERRASSAGLAGLGAGLCGVRAGLADVSLNPGALACHAGERSAPNATSGTRC